MERKLYNQCPLRVSLITMQPDVINFCKNISEKLFTFCFEQSFKQSILTNSSLILIDATRIQENQDIEFLQKIKDLSISVAFIVTDKLSTSIKDFLEENFEYLLFFPVTPKSFYSYCVDLFQKMKKITSSAKKIIPKMNCSTVFKNSLFGYFAGNSDYAEYLRTKIMNAAKNNLPVLLLGETGTGKSTCAEIIHKLSNRKDKKFYGINISTIVENLSETTLFGCEKGAYTDATTKEGLLKIADKSTLFFDEIGVSSLSLQAMLLTFLDDGKIKKVGSNETEKVDVRPIFATNEDINSLIMNGRFRQDLFFRISDNIIYFKPLRERKEDIIIYAQEFALQNKRKLTQEALLYLQEYDWPGNIRELQKCLRRTFSNYDCYEIESSMIEFNAFA